MQPKNGSKMIYSDGKHYKKIRRKNIPGITFTDNLALGKEKQSYRRVIKSV